MQVNKWNKIIGLVRRSFTYQDRKSMLTMYKTFVRPLLEYGHTIIYPRYEKDKKLIKGVQRRAQRWYRNSRIKNTLVMLIRIFILQLMPISAIDKRLCQRVKSLKYD